MKKVKIMMTLPEEERDLIREICKDRGRSMARQTVALYREEKVRIEREKQLGLRGIKL